jgi:hypothetical protein
LPFIFPTNLNSKWFSLMILTPATFILFDVRARGVGRGCFT